MTTYLATYGNGTKRLFDCASKREAARLAYNYGIRHGCGACLNVTIY